MDCSSAACIASVPCESTDRTESRLHIPLAQGPVASHHTHCAAKRHNVQTAEDDSNLVLPLRLQQHTDSVVWHPNS